MLIVYIKKVFYHCNSSHNKHLYNANTFGSTNFVFLFKKWPQEALISVSMRFQNEMEVLTNDIKPSIAHFMAYVHGSVNEMSKVKRL